jgi:hypothetical protein
MLFARPLRDCESASVAMSSKVPFQRRHVSKVHYWSLGVTWTINFSPSCQCSNRAIGVSPSAHVTMRVPRKIPCSATRSRSVKTVTRTCVRGTCVVISTADPLFVARPVPPHVVAPSGPSPSTSTQTKGAGGRGRLAETSKNRIVTSDGSVRLALRSSVTARGIDSACRAQLRRLWRGFRISAYAPHFLALTWSARDRSRMPARVESRAFARSISSSVAMSQKYITGTGGGEPSFSRGFSPSAEGGFLRRHL